MSEIRNSVRPFVIGMDYDDTFDTCRETWTGVVQVLSKAGAKVVCVTSRDGNKHPVRDFPGEVVYCCGKPKAEVVHALGIEVKIWIDDQPHTIGIDPVRAALLIGLSR